MQVIRLVFTLAQTSGPWTRTMHTGVLMNGWVHGGTRLISVPVPNWLASICSATTPWTGKLSSGTVGNLRATHWSSPRWRSDRSTLESLDIRHVVEQRGHWLDVIGTIKRQWSWHAKNCFSFVWWQRIGCIIRKTINQEEPSIIAYNLHKYYAMATLMMMTMTLMTTTAILLLMAEELTSWSQLKTVINLANYDLTTHYIMAHNLTWKVTLSCDVDIRTRPRFFSNICNSDAESR